MRKLVVYLRNSAVSAAMAGTWSAGCTLESIGVYSLTTHSTVAGSLHPLPVVVAHHRWEPSNISIRGRWSRLRRGVKLKLLKGRIDIPLAIACLRSFTAAVAELMAAGTSFEGATLRPLDEVTATRTSLPAFALREFQGLLPLILLLTISCMCLVLAHGASYIVTSRALCLVAVAGFTIVGGVVGRDELEALTVAAVRSIHCPVFNQLLTI
ncbi:uncharacterized protein FMAN_03358 [Fusarium mangiferae]|uniref:Uncharacterized protein n=1 Tax=Fusarium mangiferae TaxID=192010 RepID=A0A1L7TFU8_FUSMA|nr:uncharacterized protein FMAN_03358 [Fusarium mangiferae]CVK94131.1 uncharacterized protein FMAN_03358 [Fusarium mangiferae]